MKLFQPFHGKSMALRALLFSTQAPLSAIAPLKRMIMGVRDPKASVVPILENWVQEGNQIEHSQLQKLTTDLLPIRFNHALQMLQWMGDKGGYGLSAEDIAVQLELTSRVHGIKQVEMYFDAIPYNLRGYEVYFALLSSYAHHRCLGKAEATMQKLRELGFLRNALPYNVMLSCYYEMRKEYRKLAEDMVLAEEMTEKYFEMGIEYRKFADDMALLAEEMREKGISKDKITYSILLKVYGDELSTKKMEELFEELEADPLVNTLTMMKKSEESREGSLDEVYLSMIWYLRGKDNIDGAERFWKEWFSNKREMDFQVPRAMIYGYGMNGKWEKAEALVSRMIEIGLEPDADTFDYLASAYVRCNQMDKAVEASMKAISVSEPGWIPVHLWTIAECFEYLERQGNDVAKEELYEMLKEHSGVPAWACHDLKNCLHMGNGYYKEPRSCFRYL